MATEPEIRIELVDAGFDQAGELLDLIRRAFSYMDGLIDPPSSYHKLNIESLRQKVADETVILAWLDKTIAGCAFLAERGDHFYLGKVAIDPAHQGKGIGRLLIQRAGQIAVAAGKPALELQTRVELAANHSAFSRLGFVETARTAHNGYVQPTSITMRKAPG